MGRPPAYASSSPALWGSSGPMEAVFVAASLGKTGAVATVDHETSVAQRSVRRVDNPGSIVIGCYQFGYRLVGRGPRPPRALRP